ncbi:MAG: hypothetical protein AAGA35_02415 [Patescibacteria group bacterium]
MTQLHIINSARAAFVTAVIVTLVASFAFLVLEPQVSRAVTSGPFTISQTIDGEISFLVDAANVTMDGSINGLTGGNATGTTFAVVQTNSATGYIMQISFENQGSSMIGNSTSNQGIRDYSNTGEPTLNFTASSAALFAYTVNASTTSDLDDSFLDNGVSCNQPAGGFTANTCWRGPTTANFQVIDRGISAPTGATTTLQFLVNVPNAPVPALDSDVYTATATLTANNQ